MPPPVCLLGLLAFFLSFPSVMEPRLASIKLTVYLMTELHILLLPSPRCWGYKCLSSHPAFHNILKRFIIYLSVCMCACLYAYTCEGSSHGGQRMLGPKELEFQVVRSHLMRALPPLRKHYMFLIPGHLTSPLNGGFDIFLASSLRTDGSWVEIAPVLPPLP